MYKDGRYRQLVYWWDSEDNEYTLEGVWKYYSLDRETNQGDYAELQSLEVFDQVTGAPDIDDLLDEGGDVWKAVANDFDLRFASCIDDDWF